jgi:hypothetical protein
MQTPRDGRLGPAVRDHPATNTPVCIHRSPPLRIGSVRLIVLTAFRSSTTGLNERAPHLVSLLTGPPRR